jgi:membrane fusion protein, multidrug efflux system
MSFRENRTYWQIRHLAAGFFWLAFLILWPACGEKTPYTPPPPPKVTVVQPLRKSVTDYLEITGNTQAVKTVQLRARIEGYLERVLFQDGQPVKKGELLFLIQEDTYRAQLQQAEGQVLLQQALLEYAEIELTRYSNLSKEKAASQTDVDNYRNQRNTARANLMTAQANRDLAKLNLSYTRVTAPFDGRIDRRLVDPGNLVGSGQSTVLAELNQIDPINVYFTISDSDLARFRANIRGVRGQIYPENWPVWVGFAGEEGYPHQGKLDFAATSLSATTGTLLLRGVLPNPDGKILPGLFTRVRVPLQLEKPALLVPQEALDRDQLGAHVLVVDEKNMVKRLSVKTGALVDHLEVIEEGLAGNEWVIVKGHLRAIVGKQVTPERERATPGGTGS